MAVAKEMSRLAGKRAIRGYARKLAEPDVVIATLDAMRTDEATGKILFPDVSFAAGIL